jgi:hypothetical protein
MSRGTEDVENAGPWSLLRSCCKGQCKSRVFAVMSTAKVIIRFLNTDRVAGIVEKAVKDSNCTRVPQIHLLSDTRFYGASDMMEGVLKNTPFLSIVDGLNYCQE